MYREGVRGVIIDVDLQCVKGREWVLAAGCLERGCALGFPAEETDTEKLKQWANQPFYVLIADLTDEQTETEDGPTDALGRRPSVYDEATRDDGEEEGNGAHRRTG